MRTCLFRIRAASSRVPASWQAPPVSTARRPAATSKPEALQPGLDLAENLFQPRLDDAGEHGAGQAERGVVALLAHLGHGNDVGAAIHVAHGRAIKRLGALSGGQRRRQHAGDVMW